MADLRQITDDLLRRAGMPATRVNTTALSGPLPGMVLGERQNLADAMDALQATFQFDAVTTGGVLTFRPRRQEVVQSLTTADLLPDRDGILLHLTRLPDGELPEELNLVHVDPAADYQASVQTALRQSAPATTRKTVRASMVLTADRAKRQADMLLEAVWAERVQARFRLPPRCLALEPGDVVTLAHRGRLWTLRLLGTLFRDGVMEVEAVTTAASAYVQDSRGAGAVPSRQVRTAGESTLHVLDLPLTDTGEDSPAFFVAVGKPRGDTAWQYATVYQSGEQSGEGVSFAPRQVVTLEAITGTGETALSGIAPVAFWDDRSEVTVQLADGFLYSASDLEVLNGSNTALVGDEIIQFAMATLIAPATYTLRRLLRGRRGTAWAMAGHVVNERFVLLGPEITRLAVAGEGIGILQIFKAVSSGGLLEGAVAVPFTPQAVNLRPLAPVHLRGSRTAGGDLTLTWVRCTRRGGGWQDNSDVPLAEETERYEIEILDGSGGVVRTLGVSVPGVVYDVSMQLADFSALQSSVSVRVYQLSATVGRGTAGGGNV
jgi:Putative phage tail protein